MSALEIRINIDSLFLDEAEQEIYDILLNQHLSYNDRWYSSNFITKVMPVLRLFGIIASLFGLTLSAFVFWNKPEWCPVWVNIKYFLITFLILGYVFYILPKINDAIKNWNRSYAYKNCKKIAGKCVREARNEAPYVAEYKFEDNTVTYYRIKNDIPKLAWTRKLTGVAFHGKFATVFFRKWTSFIPRIIILHDNFKSIEDILSRVDIEFKPINKI